MRDRPAPFAACTVRPISDTVARTFFLGTNSAFNSNRAGRFFPAGLFPDVTSSSRCLLTRRDHRDRGTRPRRLPASSSLLLSGRRDRRSYRSSARQVQRLRTRALADKRLPARTRSTCFDYTSHPPGGLVSRPACSRFAKSLVFGCGPLDLSFYLSSSVARVTCAPARV